jgi:hypothetical protein
MIFGYEWDDFVADPLRIVADRRFLRGRRWQSAPIWRGILHNGQRPKRTVFGRPLSAISDQLSANPRITSNWLNAES